MTEATLTAPTKTRNEIEIKTRTERPREETLTGVFLRSKKNDYKHGNMRNNQTPKTT